MEEARRVTGTPEVAVPVGTMTSGGGKYDRARLLFRRQFILGPHFVDELPSWTRVRITGSLCLTAHPDLAIHRAAEGVASITLLGYILDPTRPGADDADIISHLLQALMARGRFEDLLARTHDLAGRWMLIVQDGQGVRIVNDACGYRQVCYTDATSCAEVWCASQPGLIADVLRLQVDPEALEFIRLYEAVGGGGWSGKEYWWPGDTSAYREIKHLVPNHYLDLTTGLPHRFWPDRPVGRLSLDEAVRKNADLLRGIMASAANRFPLALTVTAGQDTRLLLAACRDIRQNLFCFTSANGDLTEESADVTVPARLLSRLGLRHHVIHCPARMDPEFEEIYTRNMTTARPVYGPIAQGLLEGYPQERVCMTGTTMHIVSSRLDFKLRECVSGVVDARVLVKKARMVEHPFALRAAERWRLGAREIYGADVIDLFYWENKEGCWQAMNQTEHGIALEIFGPGNCRAFLANALAVRERFRRRPERRFHRELMKALWPEVLSEPINPHKRGKKPSALRSLVKDALVGANLYHRVPPRVRRFGMPWVTKDIT